MSINLTTQCLSIPEKILSQTEKLIMLVLCFRANELHEVYSSIEKLSLNCSCSVKTIERNLKKLRDKKFLIYTGRVAPNSKNIPIYRINLNHGQNDHDKTLTTDNLSFNHGQIGQPTTDKLSIWIDNKKDNKKDNGVFFKKTSKPTIEQIQDFHWHKKNNSLGIPDQLKWVEQWIDIYGIAKN